MAAIPRYVFIGALVGCLFLTACSTPPVELRPVNNPMPPLGHETLDVSRVTDMPRAIKQSPPRYPTDLRRANLQGEAVIMFIVDREGAVRDAMVLKATDYRFGEAALAAVSAWRFLPATINDRPVACRMMVPIVFRLNQQ